MRPVEFLLLPEIAGDRGRLRLLHSQRELIGPLLAFKQSALHVCLGISAGGTADR